MQLQKVLTFLGIVLSSAVFGCIVANAQPKAKSSNKSQTVFVLPLTIVQGKSSKGTILENKGLGTQLSDLIAEEIKKKKLFRSVTTPKTLKALNNPEVQEILETRPDSKEAQKLKSKINTDFLISGSVGRIGSNTVLTLNLFDLRTMAAQERVGITIEPQNAKKLTKADLRKALVGSKSPKGKVSLLERLVSEDSKNKVVLEKDLRIGIFGIDASGIKEEIVENLSPLIAQELKTRGVTTVLPKDIETVLGVDRMSQIVSGDCTDKCLVAVSGTLNFKYILTGQVGRLQETFLVDLRLLDPLSGSVHRQASLTFKSPQEDELVRAIRTLAREVIGVKSDGQGTISVASPQSGAQVYVDNKKVGPVPLKLNKLFDVGRTGVRVTKRGYLDWQSDVFLQPGENSVLAKLKPAPKKFYQKWWFWTAASVVAAGTTAAIIYAVNQAPDDGNGTAFISGNPAAE